MQRTCALLGAVALSVSALDAFAQAPPPSTTSFQLEQFEPSPLMGTDILNVSTSDVMPHLDLAAGLLFHYVNNPLALRRAAGDEDIVARLVEHQLKADLSIAIGLWERFALGFVLPMALYQTGDDLAIVGRPGEQVEGPALQDARVFVKMRLLDPDEAGGFGIHLTVPIYVPLGDTDGFGGDDSVRIKPTLGLEYRDSGSFTLALNVGYLFRPERPAHDYTSDHSVPFALGVELATGHAPLSVIGTLFGSIVFGDSRDPFALEEGVDAPGDRGVDVPLEALAGLRYRFDDAWSMQAGGGAGLTQDVGSPTFRAFVGVTYTPTTRDRDGDGVMDSDDKCRDVPEDKDGFQDTDGCPDLDNDRDQVPDVADGQLDASGYGACRDAPEDVDGFEDEDGCPDLDNDRDGSPDGNDKCPNAPEDRDDFEDEDGCPDPDNDQDKVLDGADKCPLVAEDIDGFEDEDGCPDPDNDGDGILDAQDKCPNAPETMNGIDDEDGCPDTGSKNVQITDDKIVILQKVFFAFDRDVIKRESYDLLDEVARALKDNPWITGVRVDGHTDNVGTDAYNKDLSGRRVASVVRYLVAKGVEPSRLSSKGFGFDVPLEPNTTAKGRAANRRVEFTITSVRGKPRNVDVETIENRPGTTE